MTYLWFFLLFPPAPFGADATAYKPVLVPTSKAGPALYRPPELWEPVTIRLRDETQVPTLWCKTKIMTSVYLPLAGDDLIYEILTGDDERLWQVGGEGTRIFSLKPALTAGETTALVRTKAGRAFQFRLFNLNVPPPEDMAMADLETVKAYEEYYQRMQAFDPYIAVVLELNQPHLAQRENVLAQREAELAAEVTRYRDLNQTLAAKRETLTQEMAQSHLNDRAEWLRDYAGNVDANYQVKHKKRFRWFRKKAKHPAVTRVFNDGVFTWVEIDHPSALHVYEVKPDGRFEVVNVHLEGNLYRIDRVAEVLEFRDQAKGDWLLRVKRGRR